MVSLGRPRPLNQGKGRMRGEIALCHVEKFEGKERHKDNQALLKVVYAYILIVFKFWLYTAKPLNLFITPCTILQATRERIRRLTNFHSFSRISRSLGALTAPEERPMCKNEQKLVGRRLRSLVVHRICITANFIMYY